MAHLYLQALLPITYGLLAGVTVPIGALAMYWLGERISRRAIGLLQGMAGGILARIALEAGGETATWRDWPSLARPEASS